jgi:hypothetical protein
MDSHDTQFDEAAYAVDVARRRVRDGDPVGVLAAVKGAPYAGLLRQAKAAAADAVVSVQMGDRDRADASLALLSHIVDDMERFEAVEAARPVAE